MARLTTAWTDQHRGVAVVFVGAATAGVLAGLHDGWVAVLAGAAVVATVVVALRVDGFGGIVVGLAMSALVVAVKQVVDRWTGDTFWISLGLTLSLLTLGWLVGRLSPRLGRASRPDAVAGVRPAFSSLGLLSESDALDRLEDEILRSRRHRRPLCVMTVRTVVPSDASPVVRDGAARAVARTVEGRLPSTDVPFALSAEEVGAILPESDERVAWDLVGPILDAAASASFTDRAGGSRQAVADHAELLVGIAALEDAHTNADDLLAAARAAVGDVGPLPDVASAASR